MSRFLSEIRSGILVLLICLTPAFPVFSFGTAVFQNGQDRTPSRGWQDFQQAETFLTRGDTIPALKSLKAAVKKDRRLKQAWIKLIGLLLARGTSRDLLEARWSLEDALRVYSSSSELRNLQVDLEWMSGRITQVRRLLKRILDQDPGDVQAWLRLGRSYELDGFNFRDVKSPQRSPDGTYLGTFSLAGEAQKDMDKARTYYERAIELNPGNRDAVWRLALLDHEEGRFADMERVIRGALNLAPDDPDLVLFLGLAMYRQKRSGEAWEVYQNALRLIPEKERFLFSAIDRVSTPREAGRFRMADARRRRRMEATFWTKRDPLFLTPFNERILEHHSRIAYAQLRFGRPEDGVEGWETDQGGVLLRYGQPVVRVQSRPDMFCRATSRWVYPGFSVLFEDRTLKDRFHIDDPVAFREMTGKIPDYASLKPRGCLLELDGDEAFFRDSEGKPVQAVFHTLLKRQLDSLGVPASGLKLGVFVLDTLLNRRKEWVSDGSGLRDWMGIFSIGGRYLPWLSDSCLIVVEALEERTGSAGRWVKQRGAEVPDAGALGMSGLVLAWEAGERGGKGRLQLSGVHFLPNTYNTFLVNSRIYLFFEIYGLTYDPDTRTRYRVTTTLEEQRREKHVGFDWLMHKILGRMPEPVRVTSIYEYRGEMSREPIYQNLVLQKPGSGDYKITVEIEDLVTGDRVRREKRFGLREPPERQ
jgi:GWxTD domain-containing protein